MDRVSQYTFEVALTADTEETDHPTTEMFGLEACCFASAFNQERDRMRERTCDG